MGTFSRQKGTKVMSLQALAQEKFWANKAECEDAEKAYYMRLSGAKVPAPKPAPKADEEEFDLFGSDEEPAAKPAKAPKKAGKAKEQAQVYFIIRRYSEPIFIFVLFSNSLNLE